MNFEIEKNSPTRNPVFYNILIALYKEIEWILKSRKTVRLEILFLQYFNCAIYKEI